MIGALLAILSDFAIPSKSKDPGVARFSLARFHMPKKESFGPVFGVVTLSLSEILCNLNLPTRNQNLPILRNHVRFFKRQTLL